MKEKTQYVVGFMIDMNHIPEGKDRNPNGDTPVSLIRKLKPAWQKGKLNGIGGKIEDGEKPIDAMVREFLEETGVSTAAEAWSNYLMMAGPDFVIHFFAMHGNPWLCESTTDEKVEVVYVEELDAYDTIDNLNWAVHLAVDHLKDGRPNYVVATYKSSDA